jgi:hypothetical protein
MKKFMLIILLPVLSSAFLPAQSLLTGKITDSTSLQPVPGAHVLLKGVGKGVLTNTQGIFVINNVPAGLYSVEILHIGYATYTQEVFLTDVQVTDMRIALQPAPIQLADVMVSTSAIQPVNTLSSVDIRLRPVNTSQDILRIVPGLFIAQHAGGGKAEQIFLRGFDIDHGTDINLQVDGLPVNMVSHAHGQGYSDLHFLIPELVQLADFNKGPYEAAKGDFTTAGYVDFRTKNILENNFVKLEGGQFATARAVAGINFKKNGYIATEYFRTDGFFESPQDFSRVNLTGKYTIPLRNQNRITLGAAYFSGRWNASGQVPDRAVQDGTITRFGSIDNTEGGETSRSQVYAKLFNNFSRRSSVEQQAYAIHYDFNLYSNFTFFLNDPINGDQIQQKESRMIYGYQATYLRNGSWLSSDLVTEAGAGFRYDDVSDIALYHTVRRTFLNDIQRGDLREGNYHAYISETLLSNKWSINSSLRFDYFTFAYNNLLTSESQKAQAYILSPKIKVNYQATDNLNLYLLAGSGFHSNDARVAVEKQGKDILPRALGIDAGFNGKLSKKLLWQVALWKLFLKQEFIYVGDEGIVELSGESIRQGIDISFRYQVLPWLFADADVNVTRPRAKGEPEGADYIPLAPIITTIGGLSVKHKSGLSGSLRYRYMGDRAANETNSVVAKGYFLSDLIVNYTKTKWEVGLSVENLFNINWNEAQFDTESRLVGETDPVSEIHFTPGSPFFAKLKLSFFF